MEQRQYAVDLSTGILAKEVCGLVSIRTFEHP
jgi:hypothetical protein